MAIKEMQIQRIPAMPKVPEVVRVAAYARVSADKDAAFHSLEAQTDYYHNYVETRPDWKLVEIYSDNAISGTVVDRPEFQRMMEDARAGKIDRIVTKSITRFARNTVVLLESVRELKRLGVDVYFEKEDMHSISPDGELLLTLLAMYAEEEARSASENQKWRIKKKFEQGQTTVGKMLGYRLVDGKLTIVPEEAEIVRQIFRDFLSGKSIYGIAKDLSYSGFPAARSKVWGMSTIQKILSNITYTGNLLLQKTYCPDFRTKKHVKNKGQVPMYEVTNSHEAIISIEDFNLVQEKLEKNRRQQSGNSSQPHSRHLFTGLLHCGHCGSVFRRQSRCTGKYKHFVWICTRFSTLGKDLCPAQAIPEHILIDKTNEVLGISELTHEAISKCVSRIEVPEPYRLVYILKDGTKTEVAWQHKSRRESWTPEMRLAARERALKQHRKEAAE